MLKVSAFPRQSVDLLDSGIVGCVPTQTLFAWFHELFGPRVEVVGLDAFTSTQFVDCDLATKALRGLYGSPLLRCTSCELLI